MHVDQYLYINRVASVDFEHIRTPMAKVVSTTLVSGSINTTNLPTPVEIVFQFTKVKCQLNFIWLIFVNQLESNFAKK